MSEFFTLDLSRLFAVVCKKSLVHGKLRPWMTIIHFLTPTHQLRSQRPRSRGSMSMYSYYLYSDSDSENSLSPGTSRDQLNGHLDGHFEHQCDKCDYTSRTEGRLKQHVQRFHGNEDFNDGKYQLIIYSYIHCGVCRWTYVIGLSTFSLLKKLYAHANYHLEGGQHTWKF